MRIGILGSGRGSNAEAVLAAQAAGRLGHAQVAGSLCDQPGAGILGLGPRYGVPAEYLDPGCFRTKLTPEAEAACLARLREWGVELVVLAGFMRIVKAPLLEAFPDRIINLHPSLLPAFPGLDAIGQAWEYGVKITGCTVHRVNAQVDAGEILDQAAVRIEETDTRESLEEKIHAAEHELLVAVIARLAGRAGDGA